MMLVTLCPAQGGLWNIRLDDVTLFRELTLGAGLKLAREVARDAHRRTGRDTCVEMPSIGGPVRLALNARHPAILPEQRQAQTADCY